MSFLTLFELSSLDQWSASMYLAVDSNGIDMQPIRNNSVGWIYLFILFIVADSFLAINLFISAICDQFLRAKDYFDLNLEREWAKLKHSIFRVLAIPKPTRPQNIIRAISYDICMHPHFDHFISVCVIAQCVVLASSVFGQSTLVANLLYSCSLALGVVFILEAVVKLLGLGIATYFADVWNRVDFVVILEMIGTFIYLLLGSSATGMVINLARIFRLSKIFIILTKSKTLNQLLYCIGLMIPHLANVLSFLFIVIYIYTIIGHTAYAKVAYNGVYNEQGDFRTFSGTLIMLTRFLTGEGWSFTMYSVSIDTDGCVANPQYDPNMCGFSDHPGCVPLNGCGQVSAYIYFLSFTLFVAFIFINIFTSFVLIYYEIVHEGIATGRDFHIFALHWREYDPFATQFIPYIALKDLVATLPAPLGFEFQVYSSKQMMKRIGRSCTMFYCACICMYVCMYVCMLCGSPTSW